MALKRFFFLLPTGGMIVVVAASSDLTRQTPTGMRRVLLEFQNAVPVGAECRHVGCLVHKHHNRCWIKESFTALVLPGKGHPILQRLQRAVVDDFLKLARQIKHHHRLVRVCKEDVASTGCGHVHGVLIRTDVLGKPCFAVISFRINHKQYFVVSLRLQHLHALPLPRPQTNLLGRKRLLHLEESVFVSLVDQMFLDGSTIPYPTLSVLFNEFLCAHVESIIFHTGEVVSLSLDNYFASLEIVPLQVGPRANQSFHTQEALTRSKLDMPL